MDSEKLTLLGAGAAIGAAVSYCVFGTSSGARLPPATSGMAAKKGDPKAPTYHSGVCRVKEGMLDQYTSLHDHTWEPVMAKMHEVRTCCPLLPQLPWPNRCSDHFFTSPTAALLLLSIRSCRLTWPTLSVQANMRNFVVYYHEELNLMFHHWEYVGDDFENDMAKCDNDPIINFWCDFSAPF